MSRIHSIIEYISTKNPVHTKKLRKTLGGLGPDYEKRADGFFTRYEGLLAEGGRTLEFAIDCYLKMLADLTMEALRFRETGEYTSKSFAEVNQRVYGNAEVMEYYMHGLLMSQFLWKHHYEMFTYFTGELSRHRGWIRHYLEIGGGHGLQVAEASKMLGQDVQVTVVDISPTSLDLARRMVGDPRVGFILSDIFLYEPTERFDFITIGEVLEHLEDPHALLRRAASLLADDGRIFITTPANAPTIDHIYLFRSADDIRRMIDDAGLVVETEFSRYAEDVDAATAEKHRITLLYGACLRKRSAKPRPA